jgi:hypothetical protein
MGATRAKTEFLTRVRLEWFLCRSLPNVWFVTMTFHENVIVKKEAMRRWKPVADWLKRHGIDWCGVWQQQKRGAWHHHFVVNKRIEVVGFRAFAVARGWGQFVNMEEVGPHRGARRFQDPKCLVKYLTRYLTRSFCDHVPRRVRLTSGRADNKVGTTRFQWLNGYSKAWRVGCELFVAVFSRRPGWRDRDSVMLYGCQELGLGVPQWTGT